MTKHTPGQWESKGLSVIGREPKNSGDWTTLCRMADNWTGRTVAEANARLIAAAPELLEALKAICSDNSQIVKFICEGVYKGGVSNLIDKGREIIAKAEGAI